MPPKMKFVEGEKVLCFHGPLLYEAKCVKYEVKEKAVRYFIHYNGWNKNWDEWVPESRVLKHNEASLQKQKELLKAHGAANKKLRAARKLEKEAAKKQQEKEKEKEKERASTPSSEKQKQKGGASSAKEGPSTPVPNPAQTTDTPKADTPNTASESKRKRARTDATVESEEGFTSKIEVKIRIQDELKPWLVDDWDLITRQKMLVTLPARQTVDSILDDYVKAKTAKPNNVNKDAVIEMVQGIREYFNVMLGTQLLYKFERPQYGEGSVSQSLYNIIKLRSHFSPRPYGKILSEKADVAMTSVYGAIHLLRLFVKLGGMLAYTALDEKSVQLLLTHIHDFIKYMHKNSSSLFSLNDYFVAPPEYHRKAI